jgi:hypothetical protein
LATGFPSRVTVISFSRSSIASALGQRWRRSQEGHTIESIAA